VIELTYMSQWSGERILFLTNLKKTVDLEKAFQNQPEKINLIKNAKESIGKAIDSGQINDINTFLDKLPAADNDFLTMPLIELGITSADLGISPESFNQIANTTLLSIIRAKKRKTSTN